MDKKKLALTMAVATTLTVSSVSGSLPTVVYAQESTDVIENEENVAESGSVETTLPGEDLTGEMTLPEESMPEEENQAAAGTENVENSEEADSNVAEQKTEETSVQEEKANDENVSATADNNLSGNCGATENDNVTWELRQNNSDNSNPTYTLVISGSGAMKDYGDSDIIPWNSTASSITKVVIENGVTTIGRRAFQKFNMLEEVSIPASVKSIQTRAFEKCSVLTDITIPDSVTELGYWVFSECTSLKNFSANSVTKIGDGVLNQCSALTNGSFPSLNSAGSSTFSKCTNLTSYDLGNITAIPSFTFAHCEQLSDSQIDLTGITSIGQEAFSNCTSLENVVLPDSIEEIGKAAFVSSNLSAVTIGKNTKKIGQQAFKDCTLLTSLTILSSATPLNIESSAFENTGLTVLTIPERVQSIGISAFVHTKIHSIDMTQANSKLSVNNVFPTLEPIVYISCKDDIARLDLENAGFNSRNYAVTNGGIFENNNIFTQGKLATPLKDGYVFNGWIDEQNIDNNSLQTNHTYYAKWVEKTEPTISFKDDLKLDKTYDGQAVSISENDYTLTDGAGDVTFTYQVKNGAAWEDIKDVPVNAGTYRVKAVVAENDNYKGAETDWKEFTIRKAKPTYTLPDDLVIGKGKTLATVTLPNGFAWADETQTADELGTHEFKAVYTPEDTANYETVEVMIPVEVIPNTSQVNHAPEIEVSDQTLTVGDAFAPMENVVVKDKEDKAEDLVVDVTHNVDTSKAGVYEVTYTVTDTKGAVTVKKIYVTVNPKMDVLNEVPTIHAENVTITVGDQFDPLKDVTAVDKEDGTLTDKIEVLNNSVDVNKAGVYEVTYKVTDSNGATVTKTITVTVKEKDADTPTTPEKPDDSNKPDNTTKPDNQAKPDSTTKPDNTAKPGNPTKPNKTDTPKTGDVANFGVFASMLAGSSGALAVLWKKRRKDNEND